jgi:hypothetical protein
MGILVLGLGAKARKNGEDNEKNQGDDGPVEPEDPDEQIKDQDAGEKSRQPGCEHAKFTHKFSSLLSVGGAMPV